MDRILQNQPATLTASWEEAGEDVDPGDGVTVTITNTEGVAVLTDSAVDGDPGITRSVDVTAVQTATLDNWTLVWTDSSGASITTYAEILGGFLFTVDRARKRSPLGDSATYPTLDILYYRTMAEIAMESICGMSFVPRFSVEEARVVSYGMLTVPKREIRKVRSISTATDVGQQNIPSLAGLRIMHGSSIFMPTLWNWWSLPIYVGYEHGMKAPPPRVGRACLELARRWLVESPWDERMTGYRSRDGGQIDILTASHADPFDIPEVVAVAEQYGLPMII